MEEKNLEFLIIGIVQTVGGLITLTIGYISSSNLMFFISGVFFTLGYINIKQ